MGDVAYHIRHLLDNRYFLVMWEPKMTFILPSATHPREMSVIRYAEADSGL